jgi:hypothetical protein
VLREKTDGTGATRFTGVGGETEVGVAAVMNHDGQRIASQAFGIPKSGGVRVELRALERTADPSVITLGADSRIILQQREDGVSILEMLVLENRSNKLFDPGAGGVEIPLPSDFVGAEVIDGERKVEIRKGVGVAVYGQIAPVQSRMATRDRRSPDEVRFGFVLPTHGSTLDFEQPMPRGIGEFTFITDQIPGLVIESDQISGRQERESGGKKFWLMLGKAIPPGGTLRFTARGLPAPDDTGRTVAGVLALAIIAGAAFLSRGGADRKREARAQASDRDRLVQRREKLFAELVALDERRKAGGGTGMGGGAAAAEARATAGGAERAELVKKLEGVYRELAAVEERRAIA